jgi:hypothetical protein
MFPQHVISCGGDVPQPACSPDLSSCDCSDGDISILKFLISKFRTIEELKQRIKEEITAIPKQMTHRVMENPHVPSSSVITTVTQSRQMSLYYYALKSVRFFCCTLNNTEMWGGGGGGDA